MITDRQFWLENAGDDRAGQPVNCSKRVGAAFDTCSVFCRHYIMYAPSTICFAERRAIFALCVRVLELSVLLLWFRLSSEEPMVSCRRFCQTFQGCNTSRFQEDADCEAVKMIPMGNTVGIISRQRMCSCRFLRV